MWYRAAGPAGHAVIRRQVFDLPEPTPLHVTEHQLVAKTCWCGTETVAAAPDGVAAAPASYGPRLRAVTVYRQFAQFCARWGTAQAVKDLFGVPISAGTVSAWGRVAVAFFVLATDHEPSFRDRR
jgi:hypothetical protein